MTKDEASQLEAEFGVSFPAAYRNAVTDGYPFNSATEELDTDAESLRTSNHGCRKEDPWGFPWMNNYWCIGGDGAGGFHFIDTQQSDSTVYFCDHEDMPNSIEDLDHISVTSFQQLVDDVNQLEKDMAKWEVEMKDIRGQTIYRWAQPKLLVPIKGLSGTGGLERYAAGSTNES